MATRGRRVLGVFAIAWMTATMQPCLMAMELAPGDTASTSISTDHINQHEHSANKADHTNHACPHCPPSTSHDDDSCSVTVMAHCDKLPDAKQGERILKVDLSDAFGIVYSSYLYFDLSCAPPICPSIHSDSISPTFLTGPSLNIQNCVFLN